MNFFKFLALITLVCLMPGTGFTQFYYNDRRSYVEFGVGVGAMNSITDIGGANSDKAYYINEIRSKNFDASTSIYAAFIYNDFLGLRLEGTWGQVGSSDNLITSKASLNLETKNIRNLSFRSSIAEFAIMAEIHPFLIKFRGDAPPKFSPYAIAGVGFFAFEPQSYYNGQWVNLQPLRTEGQGFTEFPGRQPYKLSQVNIPFGIGVRYELSNTFNIRLEYLHRKLFTDYLDDASSRKNIDPSLYSKYLSPIQASYAIALANPSKDGEEPPRRANPNDKDAYMTLSLKLGIVLGRTY